MNNLFAPSSTDISSQIGALELSDHMDNRSDGALEEAGMSMGDTQRPTMPRPFGGCISDGVLEAAGANMAVGPTEVNCGRNPTLVFRCASDGALEAAGVTANGGPTTTGYCPPTRRGSCLLQ
jgi:hypothetical protein